MEKELTEEQNY